MFWLAISLSFCICSARVPQAFPFSQQYQDHNPRQFRNEESHKGITRYNVYVNRFEDTVKKGRSAKEALTILGGLGDQWETIALKAYCQHLAKTLPHLRDCEIIQ